MIFYFVFMAKQIGLLRITGTIGGICFYLMDEQFYARAKSSLSGERVKKDPAFTETMRHAKRMGSASKIASVLYREMVPVHERSREKYRELVGMVMRELDATLRWQGVNHGDTKAQRNTKKKIVSEYSDGSSTSQEELNHRDTETQRDTKKKILSIGTGLGAPTQDGQFSRLNHRYRQHFRSSLLFAQLFYPFFWPGVPITPLRFLVHTQDLFLLSKVLLPAIFPLLLPMEC